MTITTKLFLAAVLPAAVSVLNGQSFVDGFEGLALDPFWTTTVTSGSITFPSSTRVHSGVQALQLNSTNTPQNKYIALQHNLAAPTYGTASVWVFDERATDSSSNYIGLFVNGGAIAVYTFDYNLGPTNGGSYVYNTAGQSAHSTIPRTRAWHQFTVASNPSNLTLSVDGITIYSGAGGQPLSDLMIYMGGPSWRPAMTSYFDDFSWTPSSTVGQSNSACASLVVNGTGATGAGPFTVAAPAGSTLNLAWSGAAHQPLALLASPTLVPGQSLGNGVVVDLDLGNKLVLFSGLSGPGRLFFSTNGASGSFGSLSQSLEIPAGAAGSSINLQGVVFDLARVCSVPGYMTTASFTVQM